MVVRQAVNWTLDDVPNLDPFSLADMAKYMLKMVRYGTNKVDRDFTVIGVTLDVYVDKGLETFLQ
tara:strand:- start:97 stop:291 length:195 start_codon:yes stop_codon:yes gene_type:complete